MDVGGVRAGSLSGSSDQLTLDAGLRYDRQTLTDATNNFAPRLGFAWHPGGDSRTVVRGGYAMYYTQIRANALASALTGGLDGIVTYTATPGQTGFPTCLTAVPVQHRSAHAAARRSSRRATSRSGPGSATSTSSSSPATA